MLVVCLKRGRGSIFWTENCDCSSPPATDISGKGCIFFSTVIYGTVHRYSKGSYICQWIWGKTMKKSKITRGKCGRNKKNEAYKRVKDKKK